MLDYCQKHIVIKRMKETGDYCERDNMFQVMGQMEVQEFLFSPRLGGTNMKSCELEQGRVFIVQVKIKNVGFIFDNVYTLSCGVDHLRWLYICKSVFVCFLYHLVFFSDHHLVAIGYIL